MIVLISGKQGSGKTSLAKNLRDYYGVKHGWSVYRKRFADPLYHLHDLIWSYMGPHAAQPKPKDGRLLQLLGTEWGRKTLGEQVWVNILVDEIKSIVRMHVKEKRPNFLITIEDARFENELHAFPEALRIRLECPPEIRKARCEAWREDASHPSEVGLDQASFDYYLNTHEACLESVTEHTIQLIEHVLRGPDDVA